MISTESTEIEPQINQWKIYASIRQRILLQMTEMLSYVEDISTEIYHLRNHYQTSKVQRENNFR